MKLERTFQQKEDPTVVCPARARRPHQLPTVDSDEGQEDLLPVKLRTNSCRAFGSNECPSVTSRILKLAHALVGEAVVGKSASLFAYCNSTAVYRASMAIQGGLAQKNGSRAARGP